MGTEILTLITAKLLIFLSSVSLYTFAGCLMIFGLAMHNAHFKCLYFNLLPGTFPRHLNFEFAAFPFVSFLNKRMVVTNHVCVGVEYCTVLNIGFQHFTGHVRAREKYVNVEIRYDPGKRLFSVSKCPNIWADAGRLSQSNTTSRYI